MAAASASHRRVEPSISEEHTSELQSLAYLVCRLLLEKKNNAAVLRVVEIMLAGQQHVQRVVELVGPLRVVAPVSARPHVAVLLFFFNDTATTEIYTLSLHDALPILIAIEKTVPWRRAAVYGTAAILL